MWPVSCVMKCVNDEKDLVVCFWKGIYNLWCQSPNHRAFHNAWLNHYCNCPSKMWKQDGLPSELIVNFFYTHQGWISPTEINGKPLGDENNHIIIVSIDCINWWLGKSSVAILMRCCFILVYLTMAYVILPSFFLKALCATLLILHFSVLSGAEEWSV